MSQYQTQVSASGSLGFFLFFVYLLFKFIYSFIYLASSRENLSSVVCEQQRRRAACASAQSDQRLCFSRFGKYHIQTCYKRNFNFLASPCN